MMKRTLTKYLIDWQKRSSRKPLIVRGARQVGKTYIVSKFGKENYKEYIELNFEETPEIKDFFKTNNVKEIIQNLELFLSIKINTADCLLFLDEVQLCPEAIVTLRYFYEKIPELNIIAAGSLLDHTLNSLQYSMPVGRVEFAYLYPMNFYEFLNAINETQLVVFLKNYELKQEIAPPIHNKLIGLIQTYFIVGGMPEAIKVYIETGSLLDVKRIHESIIKSLEYDFSKYGTRSQQSILAGLIKYIPKSIGQKFKYVNFDNSLRSEAIKKALELLDLSRLIHFVKHTKTISIPLESGVKDTLFKTIFLDIGLLNHILKTPVLKLKNDSLNNLGNLSEQFVGQELLSTPPCFIEKSLYYWIREKRNSEAEVDFIAQVDNEIIPIEVKSGKTGSLKSLHVIMYEKKLQNALRFNSDRPSETQIETSIRIHNLTEKVNYRLVSLPLYLTGEFNRLLT